MEQSAEKIIERNLLEVFNERVSESRRSASDELWDKDGRAAFMRASKRLTPQHLALPDAVLPPKGNPHAMTPVFAG